MRIDHVAVVMPAYNEAEGIAGFIDELRAHIAPVADTVTFVVADDHSTDATLESLAEAAAAHPDIRVEPQPVNRGHGPTALAAYRAGLALAPDVIVHVDGDGQFVGDDFPRIIRALVDEGADAVHGVRTGRTDPWYRRTITGAVRVVVAGAAGRGIPDVNTPLRAYRPAALRELVDAVPADALVPHVHFSLAEARSGMRVRYLRVRSIPRRGESAAGTMWGTQPAQPKLPPQRLRRFVAQAARELWRESLRPGAPMRRLNAPGQAGAEPRSNAGQVE